MLRIKLFVVLSVIIIFPAVSHSSDDSISFKGIEFGMKAEEIAKLGGGNTEYGCASAINDASVLKGEDNKPWTYGGIDSWSASCMESYNESKRIPGITGLIEMRALVSSHKNGLAKWAGDATYSVEDLVEIFSKVFGKFKIETKIVKNGLGQEFVKKEATAIKKGAVMTIADDVSGKNHEDYIHLKIVSLDYLSKKIALENKKSADKMKDAKSDF